jgi:2'-hydroxyisoflavone reductase
MRLLILGGTAWLGATTAETARDLGHDVTCLARGTGSFPPGVNLVRADRTDAGAFDGLPSYDRVIDVSRQPGQVRAAARALRARCGTYVLVSSGNVYADHSEIGATQDAPLLPPLEADVMSGPEDYGPAKVACEQAVAQVFPDEHVLARAGLIGGPGDTSWRTAYWPWRFARNGPDPVLVPADADRLTQLIDARDLARWLVSTAGRGPFDLVGEAMPLHEHLAVARDVGGHTGALVAAPQPWLTAQGVVEWMGERSLPLWSAEPGWEGFCARSHAHADAAGLTRRPLRETLRDTLAWAADAQTPAGAGLTDAQERALLAELGGDR